MEVEVLNAIRNNISLLVHGLFRFLLFVSAYIPLFVILLLKNIESMQLSFILIAITVGSLMVIKRYINVPLKHEANDKINVSKITHKGSEVLNYIACYIIPFISFNTDINTAQGISIPNLLATIILFLVICNLYMASNLYYINPVITIFYDIYNVESNEEHILTLITDKKEIIPKNKDILCRKISPGIYLYTNNSRTCKITILKILLFLILLILVVIWLNNDVRSFCVNHIYPIKQKIVEYTSKLL